MVWVGRLPESVDRNALLFLFKQAGDVKEATVRRDGTGCVAFETTGEAENALILLNEYIVDDSPIEVAMWADRPD